MCFRFISFYVIRDFLWTAIQGWRQEWLRNPRTDPKHNTNPKHNPNPNPNPNPKPNPKPNPNSNPKHQ